MEAPNWDRTHAYGSDEDEQLMNDSWRAQHPELFADTKDQADDDVFLGSGLGIIGLLVNITDERDETIGAQ